MIGSKKNSEENILIMEGKAIVFLAVVCLLVYLTQAAPAQPQPLPAAGGNQRFLFPTGSLQDVIKKLIEMFNQQNQNQAQSPRG